jgi:recombination protein RecA
MSAASKAALRAFETRFAKEFGEGKLIRPGTRTRDVVSTGSPLLDRALGVGGFIVGRCYESWGPPSLAKTTMACIYAAEHQKAYPDRMIGWLDVEHSFDEDWAKAHGVDMDRIYIVQPKSAEEVADQIRRFLDSGLFSFLNVDSIGALIAKKEIEKDAEEMVVGVIAKIVTRMIRMAAPSAAEHNTTFHVINQARANISAYGPDTTTGGGFALSHSSTAQLHHKPTGAELAIGSGKTREIVGKTFSILVAKNKVAPPLRTAQVTLANQVTAEYGPIGLDRASEAFELADKMQLFTAREGSWYTLPDGTRHNGGEATKIHLRANPKAIEQVRELALKAIAHTVVEDDLKEGAVAR